MAINTAAIFKMSDIVNYNICTRVCDKNIGKVDNSFYLPYNLVNYKQPERGDYGRINRVFAAEKEISVP